MTEYTHEFCCESLQKLDYDNDNQFYFTIVNDTHFDFSKQKLITKAEPFPAVCYEEPNYGNVTHEQFRINNCPFCGKKIKILTLSHAIQSQPKVKDEK